MAKKKAHLFEEQIRIINLILGSILTAGVLCFSCLTIIHAVQQNYEKAPFYLIWVFVLMGLTRISIFIKKRTKLAFIRFLVLLIVDIGIGLSVLLAKDNHYIFAISAGLYCISIIISRVFKLIARHQVRDFILSGLIIALAIALAIGFFSTPGEDKIPSVILMECILIAAVSFIEISVSSFSQLRIKVLFKIIIKTYAIEVLLGLLTTMIVISLVLTYYEPTMANFPDALWYCFAVVTTIGFGDFVATSIIGRVLTVILGLYGIIVVAVITSIIVNFYNETAGKKDTRQLKEITKDDDED